MGTKAVRGATWPESALNKLHLGSYISKYCCFQLYFEAWSEAFIYFLSIDLAYILSYTNPGNVSP